MARMLRFGRWGFSLDQWLEGLGSPSLQGDAASPVPFLKLLFASDSILPADTIASQPAHDDSASVTPLGTAAEPLAADPPIWLLPETASASAPIFPLGANDSEESSATASFVTPSGDHFAFLSSEPAFGLGGGLFVNTDTRTILTEAEAGRIGLGSGGDDQLVLGGGNGDSNLLANGGNGLLSHGSESGAMSLAGFGAMFERIVLLDGSDYNLAAVDGNVGAGRTLTVSALALGAGNHLSFDGSAETAGRFVLEGGAGDDSLIGGHGADNLYGGAGADSLAGGAGADRFVYMSAAESTGAHYDTILDFTFGEDVIDLPVTVPGLDAAVTTGALSQDSFDADLAAALGGSALEAGHALFFTPDSGALAGQTFLVVDANGEAGYQAGVDFVIHFATQPPAGLHDASFLA